MYAKPLEQCLAEVRMPISNDKRISDDVCKMLSTVLNNIKSQINDSYFHYRSIPAFNFWQFN